MEFCLNINKKILLFLIVIMTLVFHAKAEEWVRIDLHSERENSEKHFLDLDGIRPFGDVIHFWEKYIERDKSYFETKVSIHCGRKEFKLIHNYKYNDKDEVIESDLLPSQWVAITPHSQNDLMYSFLCREGRPKPSDEFTDIRHFREGMLMIMGVEEENLKGK